nr:glucoamylase family protein [Paenibacillus bovis]
MNRLKLAVIAVIVIVALGAGLIVGNNLGWFSTSKKGPTLDKETEALLDEESRKSFDFFWNETTTKEGSPGYGLIRDRYPGAPGISSVASVGYGLSAYVIGVERGWVTHDEAYERTLGTLNTLLNTAEHVNGHFYHFLDMNTGKRAWNSEVSVIDTAIAINGAFVAAEYFGGEIKDKAEQLYKRVDWEWYRDKNRNMFYMGYHPESGFAGNWDFYAEQLMMYFLGSASPTHPTNTDMFYDFQRHLAGYGGYPKFIHSWFGSIFTYQFSHAWFDLRHLEDKKGVDWYSNSIIASLTSRKYAIDQGKNFETLGPNSWGMTASDGPKGYNGLYGDAPSGFNNDAHFVDGTVPPAGAAGSIVFTPEETINALKNYKENHPELWGKYGFKDAYNLDVEPDWYATDVIGINKGITLLMIENFRTGLIWDLFMQNNYVQSGLKKVGLTPKNTVVIDDFESNVFHDGWFAKDVNGLQMSDERAFTGLYSLKVEVGNEISAHLHEIDDEEEFDMLRAHIYGDAAITVTLLDEDGKELVSEEFKLSEKDEWNELLWDLSDQPEVIDEVSTIRILPEADSTEEIYLDDLQFIQHQPAAHHVVIHGDPIVGKTLTGSYVYYDPLGEEEGDSTYQWYISDKSKGDFDPIDGATSLSYTVKEEDAGKFIKFEVVPKSKAKGIIFKEARTGTKVESEFTLKIEQ